MKVSKIRYAGLIVLLLCAATVVQAQSTRVRGRVTEAATGEPMPFVSVTFPGTTVGISTDMEGCYALETREEVTEVRAEIVGYVAKSHPVKRAAFNEVNFALEEDTRSIAEVVIRPGDNPAWPILDSVVTRRRRNDPELIPSFSYRTYTKMELDLQDIKPRFKNKRLQRNFGFIFEHMDTSAVTGRRYLPVMIAETSADYYRSRDPEVRREVIRANRISGIDNPDAVAQFTGHLHAQVNLYDPYIDVFDLQFAGPLSPSGRSFYNYFLIDSVDIAGRKTYKIRFHPRSVATPVLDGEVNIDSASWGLRSAAVTMARRVNVNWIRHLSIESRYRLQGDTLWTKEHDRIVADFSVTRSDSSKTLSFLGSRLVEYADLRVGEPLPEEIREMHNNVVVDDELQKDERYWDSIRPYALSAREQAIYTMVDSVRNVPLFRNIYTVINTALTGYYNTRYIGLGPYYKALSFNDIEGWRLRLGARTTKRFSNRVRIGAYMAYGTRNERFRGGGSLEVMFHKRLMRKLTVEFQHDLFQLGASENALSESNILSTAFSRGNERLCPVNDLRVEYIHEWRPGLQSSLTLRQRNIHANRFVPFVTAAGAPIRSINVPAVGIGLRYAKDEIVLRNAFGSQSMGSPYPIVRLDLTGGIDGLLPRSCPFLRLEAQLHYKLELPPVGYSLITLTGGKVFGRVPYPLLKIHEGNGTYFYNPTAFSCMNFFEFASDRWVSLFYEHHFNGALLGRVPLLKRLHWREVFVFKGVYGDLEGRNNGSANAMRALMRFPAGMGPVNRPYLEMGFGIENIFKLLRVDFIWRLNHLDTPSDYKIQHFAINGSIRLRF